MASIAIWLFFAYLANVSVFTSASSAEMSSKDKDKTICTTKLDVCSMKVENEPVKISLTSSTQGAKGDQGMRGPFGQMGDRGYPGEMGLVGPPGRRGEDGLPGRDGPPGITGEKGDRGIPGRVGQQGLRGPPGDEGEKGFPGRMGPQGDKGLSGMLGEKGDEGFPGFKGEIGPYGTTGYPGEPGKQGPPGPPGINGSCPCHLQKVQRDDVLSEEEEEEDGSMSWLNNLCRYASIPIKNRNRYLMGPEKFEVICDERDGAMFSFTCVPPVKDAKLKMLTFSSATKPYWLKNMGDSIKDLYGLTRTQIAWMHEKSDGAYQKLRIHSKNTMPYYQDEPARSLLMLSWNDITFGPTPTKTTPFVYTVPTESDTCFNATHPHELCESIIEIDSDSFQRLPVVNFLVRDLKDEEISIGIEPLELCFY